MTWQVVAYGSPAPHFFIFLRLQRNTVFIVHVPLLVLQTMLHLYIAIQYCTSPIFSAQTMLYLAFSRC
jgi:hypothetical protein